MIDGTVLAVTLRLPEVTLMKCLARSVISAGLLFCGATLFAQTVPPSSPAPATSTIDIAQTTTALSGTPALTAEDASAWLDGLVPYAVAQGDIASTVIVVVKDGKVLVSKGYGYADIATKKPVDPATTLFRPGSISKLFVWTSVMQLVEQGKLDLDQDVNTYLDFTIPPRDGKPITLRNLMTHTPGFEETAKNLFTNDPKTMMDNGTWLKAWVPERVYAPGEVAAYSNYGAALAGYIVQRVSGEPFESYIEKHIYQPLGMTHASFRQPLPDNIKADMATGYMRASQPARAYELVIPAPAGSMAVSGDDIAHFMIAHLQNGRYGDAQILRPQTAAQMHGFKSYPIPGLPPIALGFYHMDQNGQTIIGHDGDTELFHSKLALLLDHNVGIFISVDGGDGGGATHLRHALLHDFVQRYFPGPIVAEPTLPTAREHGALVVGRYLNSRVSVSNFLSILNLLAQPTVAMDADGNLITPDFKNLAGQPRHWREVRPFIWRDDADGGLMGAVMDGNKVRWLSIDEVAPVMVFRPVPASMSAAWNLPLLYGAIFVWFAALLLWPIAALVRRHYRKPCLLKRDALRWYRWSRLAALANLLLLAGWVWVLATMQDSIGNMTNAFDGSLRLVQLIGVLALAGVVAAFGNAFYAWRERSGWWRKLNSLALLLACLATVWFTFSLHLLNLHLNY
jgi:CubicO group peptidase (beta-lactamase class C family)